MKRSLVNYDTQWKNKELISSESFYFKAYTPIEEIVAKLEMEIKNRFSSYRENYPQRKSAYLMFNRLYRNTIKSYKGWEVSYRKPESKEDYGSIREQIGYKPKKNPKQSLQRTVLTKTLRWTHELYPLIDQVEIKGAESCETIAQILNQKIKQPGYNKFLKHYEKEFADFSTISKQIIHQNKLGQLDCKTNDICETFSTNLINLANLYGKLPQQYLKYKPSTIQACNISDVLQKNKLTKTAKGWAVEILEN